MREKYEKPQMNADERRFVEMVSAVYNLLLCILENIQTSLKNTCRVAICLPPARALAMCMVATLMLSGMSGVHRERKIGHALWIVLAITTLGLIQVGGAGAENSYEFVLKIPSSQQWNFYSPSGIAVDNSGNFYVTNRDNDWIQKFSASGGFLAKWGSYGSGDGQFWNPAGIAVDSAGNVYVADGGNQRIQKFSASGVFLAKWGSYGGGDGQFNNLGGVAVDSAGNVYVVDGNQRIQKFSASGGFLAKWGSYGSGDGQFWNPAGIAVDSTGNVYVADGGNNRIQKFSASGGFLAKWGSSGSGDGQFNFPRGIAMDSAGNVYVADGSNTRIQKFSASGGFLAKWGSYGKGDSQFIFPEGIAVDSAGNVYVADSVIDRIQKFSASGGFLTKWGSYGSGDGQFQLFMGVAVDGGGNIYVADTENARIQKFSSSGGFLTKWGSLGIGNGQFNYPKGIAVDSAGNVYVADTFNHRIQKFSASGGFLTKWGSYGSGDGQFNMPGGIALDSVGNIYVADTFNHRIQKFSASGGFLAKWGNYGIGDGQLNYPDKVAVDSAGNVYVAESNGNRIQKFSASGGFLAKWGSIGTGDGQFQNIGGIGVDSEGNIYIVDNPRIQKFSASGGFLAKWGSEGSGDYEFKIPFGIAVDSAGNVYVADSGNHRIQKFIPTTLYTITTITVSPATSSVVVGNTQTFIAAPKDQNGNAITASITWSSSNQNVGTINANKGVFTAITAGTTTITATSGSVYGTATATVTTVTPTITPTPSTGTIAISSTPSGASIYFDGVYKGTTPKVITNVTQVSHEVKLTLSGYNDWSHTALAAAGSTSYLKAELITATSGTATATVNFNQIITLTTDKDIYIKGEQINFTITNKGTQYIDAHLLAQNIETGYTILIWPNLPPECRNPGSNGPFCAPPAPLVLSPEESRYISWQQDDWDLNGQQIHSGIYIGKINWSYQNSNIQYINFYQNFTIVEPELTTITSTETPEILNPELLFQENWMPIGIAIIVMLFSIYSIIGTLRKAKSKANVIANEEPKPVAAPSEDPGSKSQAVFIEKPKEPLVEKPKESGTISVKSAYEYRGAKIYYKIKIENNAIEPVGDIKVHLFVPEVFLLAEKEKAISMLETKESKTVTFKSDPLANVVNAMSLVR